MPRYAGQAMGIADQIAESVASEATLAALAVLDKRLTNRAHGTCGDALAQAMRSTIERAVKLHLLSNDAHPIL